MTAAIAQLGERQTEDLKVPGSIPGGGILFFVFLSPSNTQKQTVNAIYEMVTSNEDPIRNKKSAECYQSFLDIPPCLNNLKYYYALNRKAGSGHG